MRSLKAMAILLGTLSVMAVAPEMASGQGGSMGPSKIAVIDVAKIFREHAGIKAQIDQVNNTLSEYQKGLQAKQNEIKQAYEALKTYKQGTPEFAAQEEKVASMDSKLRLEAARRKQELAKQEAKIYYENYQKIQNIVQQLAEYNQIDLVLRYNSEEMNLENADTVLRGVMKNVVYRHPNRDLTSTVMQVLDQQLRTAAQPGGTTR